LNLRVHCFNFDAGILTVHDGKGKKDRTVPLPQTLVPTLKQQLQKVVVPMLRRSSLYTSFQSIDL